MHTAVRRIMVNPTTTLYNSESCLQNHTPHNRCHVGHQKPPFAGVSDLHHSSTYSKVSGPCAPTELIRSRAASGLKVGSWQKVRNSPVMRRRRPSSVLGERPLQCTWFQAASFDGGAGAQAAAELQAHGHMYKYTKACLLSHSPSTGRVTAPDTWLISTTVLLALGPPLEKGLTC